MILFCDISPVSESVSSHLCYNLHCFVLLNCINSFVIICYVEINLKYWIFTANLHTEVCAYLNI